MPSASPAPSSRPLHLTELAEVIGVLRDFAVEVSFAHLPTADVAHIDADRRTVVIRHDAPAEDRMWALGQAATLLTVGAAATALRPLRARHLAVVPD